MSSATGISEQHTFCRSCLAGCGLVISMHDGEVVKVAGDRQHPGSHGYTCRKGRSVGAMHRRADRLNHARIGSAGRWTEVSAEQCLDDLAARLRDVMHEAGASRVGTFLGNGTGPDSAGAIIANRLIRALGSGSRYSALTVDCPSKPLVADLMGGLATLSAQMSPVVDERHCRLTLFIGTNPVVSHGHTHMLPDPVRRIRAQARSGEVWVLDPRRTETAQLASRYMRTQPGSDYAVLAHLVRELLVSGADRDYLTRYCSGLDDLERAVAPFTLEHTAELSGTSHEDLADLLAAIRRSGRLAIQTGTGVTMGETANVTEWLAWALLLVTGSMDRRGGAVFSTGYFSRLHTRGAPAPAPPTRGPSSRPELPGVFGELPSTALLDEIESGNLQAVLVFGGNPMSALPDTPRARKAFAKLSVLAAFDIVENDIVSLATHVMPCTAQLERSDISLLADNWHSEQLGQYTPALLQAVAERRPMWWWLARLGQRLGHDLVRGDPNDMTADEILRPMVDRRGDGSFDQLVHNGVLSDGEPPTGWVTDKIDAGWQLAPAVLVAQLQATGTRPGGIVLLPHREHEHFNSLSYAHQPDVPIRVHPDDAHRAGIRDGQRMTVSSSGDAISGRATFDVELASGCVSIRHGHSGANVNVLTTTRALDALTAMVRLSGVPVTLRAADAGAVLPEDPITTLERTPGGPRP